MAQKLDIQYVRYYTDGSAARELQPELPQKRRKARLPKQKVQPELVIPVDPLALAGILVATVMLVLMIVGCVQLDIARDQETQMLKHVEHLTQDNAEKYVTYRNGYDLETVRQDALGMGMVPIEQAKHVQIVIPVREVVEEPTVWERVQDFFTQLFA